MKPYLSFLFLLLSALFSQAQNLVPNPSFDENYQCPEDCLVPFSVFNEQVFALPNIILPILDEANTLQLFEERSLQIVLIRSILPLEHVPILKCI